MAVDLRRLMGTASAPVTPIPTLSITRFAGNPVIPVDPPGEPAELYKPAPFLDAADAIECMVKGGARIYDFKSTDGGETMVGQNSGNQVIGPGAGGSWDDVYALEPAALRDRATAIRHAWYKASGGGVNDLAWGYATALDGTPYAFTKDPANPILTSPAISTAMGGLTVSDTAPDDVVLGPDGLVHFFGYACYDGTYQIIHLTGTAFNAPDPDTLEVLLTPPTSATIAAPSCVFRVPGLGSPRYGMFYTWGALSGSPRSVRVAWSTDPHLSVWDFSDTTDVMAPIGAGFEQDWVYTLRLLKRPAVPFMDPRLDELGRLIGFYSGADLGAVTSETGLVHITLS